MRSIQIVLVSFLISNIFLSCARKCPADIKLGNLGFSATTKAWLPDVQNVNQMTFVNAVGEKLTFNNTSSNDKTSFQMDIETLCQRGDYIDKTTQTTYFEAETKHFYYDNTDQSYTLAIDMQINNHAATGKLADTVFYETFACWGQKLSTPTATGGMRTLTDDHQNGTKLPDYIRSNSEKFHFVADTIVEGKTLQNVYYNANGSNEIMTVFYSKIKGIEGFIANGVVWWKE